MLQFRHRRLLFYLGFSCAAILSGCTTDHFFPRLKPLFAGFDESKIPASARKNLAEAKEDFQCCRHGALPRHARYAGTIAYTHSKVFEGRGYRVTVYDKDLVRPQEHGPGIVLGPSITGAEPFEYEEVNRTWD